MELLFILGFGCVIAQLGIITNEIIGIKNELRKNN